MYSFPLLRLSKGDRVDAVWYFERIAPHPLLSLICLNYKALGVGAEYVQQERLSDLLRCELRENIREEEERRAAARGRAAARKAEEAEEAEGAEGAEGAGDQNGK